MSYALSSLLALMIGYLLDMLLGDPQGFPHIIRLVGHAINGLEKMIRVLLPKTPRAELFGGILMVILTLLICAGAPTLLLIWLYRLNIYAGLALESFFCYQLLATRALKDESMLVFHCLKRGDIAGARKAVSMIVGRDTKSLDDDGITRAVVETVAENTSDGVMAPILYMALGGAALGLFYKTVNTMDSMIAYKNDQYLYFGRAAAKLDDLLNYIPARLSALMMILVSVPLGLDAKGATRIYKRDRRKHESPNSAHSEATCAGALGIALGGNAYYFGQLHEKPTLGDALRPIRHDDIKSANHLMMAASILTLALCVLVKVAVIAIV